MAGNESEGDTVADQYENSGMKKRVAYEKADRVDRPAQTKATNHVQNAMQVRRFFFVETCSKVHSLITLPQSFQSVLRRQEVVRKQFELKQQKEVDAVAKREQEKEKARASALPGPSAGLLKSIAAVTTASKMTPLISPAVVAAAHAHRQPNRPIAAVSNLMAIQRAKEKIEEMKAAKLRQQNSTAAHTVAKGVARVAHTSKAVETAVCRSTFFAYRTARLIFQTHLLAAYASCTTGFGAHGHQNIIQHSLAVLQYHGQALFDYLR